MSTRFAALCLACAVGVAPASAAGPAFDPELLAGMRARALGPAGMSGRVAAVEAIASEPNVIFVGAATGGVWKSVNAGLTWEPIFDDQPAASIGAIAVFQPNPDIVWVGTGEGNPRNSTSAGNGIYRSLDGGRTWEHMGLEATERIHRVLTHPADPDVVYVAALGRAWGENPERGVFKTNDGGRTWRKILYVDERTGCADLAMDPSNPDKLIGAMWDYRRWPWFFRSGGPGSGLYITVDGGESWKRLTPEDGLPEGDLGRMGVAFSRSDPEIVYAIVEARKNDVLRSVDGGFSWKSTGAEKRFGNRPFYFGDLRVDPERPNRVYSLWSLVSVSEDGGKTWRVLVPFKEVHPDHHAMWIDPRDGRRVILGNDGGIAFSSDRGWTWRFVSNLPLAQYYHIRVDNDVPYHVYGGMQDNGSWRGPSAVWENGGIRNHHWEEVGFGDGFDTLPDPEDSTQGYAMSQEGYLIRWNLDTGERRSIRPAGPADVDLRFNWNAGIAIDPFDPATVYFGSQFVHRSRDRGRNWEIISPDLTTNDPDWQKQAESGGLTPDVTGAENFTTIVAIAPSPRAQGVLWIGTDDGRIHVTRDGGDTWTSVEGNVKGVPRNTWVPHIEPSPFEPGEALAVFDDHRRSNWETYLYRASEYGRRWTRIPTNGVRGWALVVVQDPVDPDLLFLGTEFGLWVTVDAGKSWMKWTHGYPTVPTRDLVLHPREHDLIIGTHGRGAFVLDDIRPLRSVSAEALSRPVHLFEIPPVQQHAVKQTGASRFPGHGEFRGENRPYGALLTYSLSVEGLPHPNEERERARKEEARRVRGAGERKDAEGDGVEADEEKEPEAVIEIFDASGGRIRTLKAPARLGVNRAVWDLRRDRFREPPRDEPIFDEQRGGPEVPADTYRVVVSCGEHEVSGAVTVLPDPRVPVSGEERRAKWETILRAGGLQETVAEAVERIHRVRSDVEAVMARASERWDLKELEQRRDDPPRQFQELEEASESLLAKLGKVEKLFWKPPETKGIEAETDALSRIRTARRFLRSSWESPTVAQVGYLRRAEVTLQGALDALDAVLREEVSAFRQRAAEADLLRLLPEIDSPRVPPDR